MDAKDLTLNIAVNLDRLARFSSEGRKGRVVQFLKDTDNYVTQLDQAPKTPQFEKTYLVFAKNYQELKKKPELNAEWAERALTWSNILTHRAKLA
jgi:hypothetical protein